MSSKQRESVFDIKSLDKKMLDVSNLAIDEEDDLRELLEDECLLCVVRCNASEFREYSNAT